MIGVARQVALAQQTRTEHYKNKPLGILDEKECVDFIQALDRLQDAESRLYHYVSNRVKHEMNVEARRALAEKREVERI